MGNRAMVISKQDYDKALKYDAWAPAVYIHWADMDEVEKFLDRMEREGYRSFESDPPYALARFCQVACEEYIDGNNVGITCMDPHRDPSYYGLDVGYWIVDGYELVDVIEPHY